jgi:hypothetical protein
MQIPHETYLPFFVALGLFVFFLGALVTAVQIGVVGVGIAIVAALWWTWRTDEDLS